SYYLASAADSIYLQPEGGMDWSGLSMSVMFYKGLLDKLDLKAEVFRPTACTFKSAVEPYILDRMSEANRTQMLSLANSLWGTISAAVSESRGIDSATLQLLADNLQVSLPEDALKHHFVDGLLYEDQMDDVFGKLGVEPASDGKFAFVTLGEYTAQVGADLKNISASQVAVIYADGAIVDGEGVYGGYVYGNTLATTLAKVRDDDRVKSVVLRVNSPGGSALASDVIWREMELLRAKKPVIVSMGSYAASGGYYISAPADAVVADRMTLTGSIGVYGMYLNTVDALKNKLGITLDAVKTNTSAGMGTTGALTAAERGSVMRGVDKVYTTFTNHVAAGRNLPIEKVLEIAGGRVWTGAEAQGIGLIDTYGGLKTAIAVAADKAELGDAYRVVEVLEQPEGLAALFSGVLSQARAHLESSELGVMMKQYRKVQEITSQQGVVMYEPRTFTLE
ncbi:MAG: signal peptide peptidase SppA, partial [Alistipes sp.]